MTEFIRLVVGIYIQNAVSLPLISTLSHIKGNKEFKIITWAGRSSIIANSDLSLKWSNFKGLTFHFKNCSQY